VIVRKALKFPSLARAKRDPVSCWPFTRLTNKRGVVGFSARRSHFAGK